MAAAVVMMVAEEEEDVVVVVVWCVAKLGVRQLRRRPTTKLNTKTVQKQIKFFAIVCLVTVYVKTSLELAGCWSITPLDRMVIMLERW